MVKVEGIAVDGTIVAQLNNKVFEVISKPQYTEFEDEGITRRKATFRIKSVENEAEYDYYPNKTSIKTLVKMHGDEMDEWVEKRFEFLVTPQMVRGEEKKVLYVKYNEGIQISDLNF